MLPPLPCLLPPLLLQEAGIPAKLAPTIGIAVDHRRRNRSLESLQVGSVVVARAFLSGVGVCTSPAFLWLFFLA